MVTRFYISSDNLSFGKVHVKHLNSIQFLPKDIKSNDMMIKSITAPYGYTIDTEALKLGKIEFNKITEKSKNELMEELFIKLFNKDLTIKIIDSNNISYYRGDELIIECNHEMKTVNFDYTSFWSDFEDTFNLNYHEVREVMDYMVIKYLNCRGYLTSAN